MKAVELKLAEARRRRWRNRILGATALVLVVAGSVLVYLGQQGVGHLEVRIAPDDAAQIAEISIQEGTGLMRNSSIWALKGPLKLQISAEGFEPDELEISDSTWNRGKVDVVLRELGARLQVRTEPELTDTLWYLNDLLVSQGPRFNTLVDAGTYEIGARHPYYHPSTREVVAKRGGEHQFNLPWSPVKGRLSITTQPDQARVSINAVPAGRTPLDVEVQGGRYTLSIERDGYDLLVDIVQITNEFPKVDRHYKLKERLLPVTVELSPEGGTLILDGRAVNAQPTLTVHLPEHSRHTLHYSKPGYLPDSVDFTVGRDSTKSFRLDLAPEYGQVHVSSEPSADITVNGKMVGQTPQQLTLQTIPQTIEFSRPGFVSETRHITPDRQITQQVSATLITEKQHRLESSPSEYSNSAGITMKLFKRPDAIILGSSRGEIGRRANEQVREVRLTRPFYAGIHEVTEEQFQLFQTPGPAPAANRKPVTDMDWITAAQFCNWLSTQEGLVPVYRFSDGEFVGSNPDSDGYRMLTEAEWEWLARKAGRARQTLFPWGDSSIVPPGIGNLADESAKGMVPLYIERYNDGYPQSSEIGLFKENAAGIHDLAGNVSEWVHDVYTLKPPAETTMETDPFDTGNSARRTIKGSNWRSASLTELRAAWRDGSLTGSSEVGFRVARYLYSGP